MKNRIPAIIVPPSLMKDIKAEATRTAQTVTNVVRSRLMKEFQNRKENEK